MDYQLYELPSADFENLVHQICLIILGVGTTKFSKGKDGGRDSRFNGTANNFPSKGSKWSGKFIIQAKGEGDAKDSCSDASFMQLLDKELAKIKILIKKGEIDNYLLFTSRKMSADRDALFIQKLKKEIPEVKSALVGRETITQLIDKYPELIKTCNLRRFYSPLRIHPQQIKEIINGFKKCRGKISGIVSKSQEEINYILKSEKNKLNKLSEEYFAYVKESSLIYFREIDHFLKDPKNQNFKESYLDAVDEIKNKIIISRGDFNKFDEIFGHLYDLIYDECCEEISERRLITVFLHYMYWNCDIGLKVGEK
jgi:hypothetical protein